MGTQSGTVWDPRDGDMGTVGMGSGTGWKPENVGAIQHGEQSGAPRNRGDRWDMDAWNGAGGIPEP